MNHLVKPAIKEKREILIKSTQERKLKKCICCNKVECDVEEVKEPQTVNKALSGKYAESGRMQ